MATNLDGKIGRTLNIRIGLDLPKPFHGHKRKVGDTLGVGAEHEQIVRRQDLTDGVLVQIREENAGNFITIRLWGL